MPDQIAGNRTPYYEALEAADKALKEGPLDLSAMEALLSQLLANQLASVLKAAQQNSLETHNSP